MIVFVGGVTRLTHSGLSMVDWNPIMGVIPPLNTEEWVIKFNRYKEFPEYKLINNQMTLSQFKSIFFWEYFHRILGRFVGILFFFPWLYFTLKKKIARKYSLKFFGVFILGGLQGLMGWYMVKSGLVNNPYVSHYRLAAHLSLALVLLCALFWLMISLYREDKNIVLNLPKNTNLLRKSVWGIFALICLQIVFGAFTAGLKAGFYFNTFPKMDGNWIPKGFFSIVPIWINFFENGATVQFIHRLLGVLCFVFVFWVWGHVRKLGLTKDIIRKFDYLLLGVVTQFLLGVFTLLYMVPITLASAHQMGACVLLILSLNAGLSLGSKRISLLKN